MIPLSLQKNGKKSRDTFFSKIVQSYLTGLKNIEKKNSTNVNSHVKAVIIWVREKDNVQVLDTPKTG